MSRFLLFIVILNFMLVSHAQQGKTASDKLPDIGTAGITALTIDKEMMIGDQLMRQIRGHGGVLFDPVLQDYLQDVGNRLVVLSDDVRFPFTFFFVKNPQINAFAFYGGHIGINTGLVAAADNESELASVLAHEIAHVTQRHLARRMESQQQGSEVRIASLLASIALAVANPQAGMAAIMGNMGIASQMQINHTRKNEKEADRVGMNIIQRSPYDPRAASTFFAKLAEKNRYNSKILGYLQTHPMALDRVADSRSRYSNQGRYIGGDELLFQLTKARINVRYQGDTDWIEYYRDKSKKQPTVAAYRYGLALAYFENNQFEKAHTQIAQLRFRDARNLFYIDTASDIAIAQKNYDYAVQMLKTQLKQRPNNRVLVLNMANVLLQNKNFTAAIQLLRDFTLDQPNDVLARELLVEGYQKSNQAMDLNQEKAELYSLMGAYKMGVDALHKAYNVALQSNNTLEMQRINARIVQLKRQINLAKEL